MPPPAPAHPDSSDSPRNASFRNAARSGKTLSANGDRRPFRYLSPSGATIANCPLPCPKCSRTPPPNANPAHPARSSKHNATLPPRPQNAPCHVLPAKARTSRPATTKVLRTHPPGTPPYRPAARPAANNTLSHPHAKHILLHPSLPSESPVPLPTKGRRNNIPCRISLSPSYLFFQNYNSISFNTSPWASTTFSFSTSPRFVSTITVASSTS